MPRHHEIGDDRVRGVVLDPGDGLGDRGGSLGHYLEEETGHEQWILNDIEAAGGDGEAAAASAPNVATEAMVVYAYDTVMRRNPLGFFGMVHVLEGTSVALALNAAGRIQQALDLPATAFTYLRSHGELDKERINDLAAILERFTDAEDREAVTAAPAASTGCTATCFAASHQPRRPALRRPRTGGSHEAGRHPCVGDGRRWRQRRRHRR